MDSLDDKLVFQVFPKKEFIVDVSRDDEIHAITFNVANRYTNKFCTIFTVHENTLYIKILEKCGNSGTGLLNKIEEFAKLCSVKTISLTDESQVDVCRDITYSKNTEVLDFATLRILTTGESWYNSIGYKSENYEQEKFINNGFIISSYASFIGDQNDEIRENGEKLFPDTDINQTVQSYFKNIMKIIKCGNTQQAEWLSDILDIIKTNEYIVYSRELTKNIDTEKSGGTRKRRKWSKRTKKTRGKKRFYK